MPHSRTLSRIQNELEELKVLIQEGRPCPELLQKANKVRSKISAFEKKLLMAHFEEELDEILKPALSRKKREKEIQALINALKQKP